MKKSEGITNAIQSKPTHSVETTESGNRSSPDDIVFSTPHQDTRNNRDAQKLTFSLSLNIIFSST